MKRDWNLIRKQLTDVEEENDLFSDIPDEPTQQNESWDEFHKKLISHRALEAKIFGHYELLIKSGYIEGVHLVRSADGQFSYGLNSPRLTMLGHDLLDTMRSPTIWGKIKDTAKEKGVELTFDAIKTFGAVVLQSIVSK